MGSEMCIRDRLRILKKQYIIASCYYKLSMVANMWVLLDFDGLPIRYYTYPAEGTVEVKEVKYVIDWSNFEEALF